MKMKSFGLILSSLIALSQAKQFTFNVVSILGEGSSLGVKYGETVKPLTSDHFPLFTGNVEADDIKEYHYVALDATNKVIEEETIKRTYTDKTATLNEVYNRNNKEVNVPNLPRPFKGMYKMGSDKFQPLPKNVIYNVYAKCNETQYSQIVNTPFNTEEGEQFANCTINIVSPDNVYSTDGSIHAIGFGSRLYKKLSFGLKFDKKILGRKGLKLRAMALDASLVREQVATELFKASGVPVQEGTYARLFLNNHIFGLYYMIDSFNDRWLGAYINGDEKAKVGISYKLNSATPSGPFAELKYLGEDPEPYTSGNYHVDEYEKKEIAKEDYKAQYSRLIQFTKLFEDWVNTYGTDNSQKAIDELKKFFNIEGLLRLLAIETLIMAIDNFWLAMTNAALYYNPERDNYLLIPFDFDDSLYGSKENEQIELVGAMRDCLHWADSDINQAEQYFTKNIMSHPQVKERYDVILAIATRQLFDSKVLTPYINSLVELIDEDVEWNFNAANNLDTAYDGKVYPYTLEDFKANFNYDKTNYNKEERLNETLFGLSEYVDLRGDSCKIYTEKVDTSKNENISEDVNVEEHVGTASSQSGAISTKQLSFLIALVPLLLLLL